MLETKQNQQQHHGYGQGCLALAALIVALAIYWLNPPRITDAVVNLPAKPAAPPEVVTLPFSRVSEAVWASFRVKADLDRSFFSSGRLRLAPDGCVNDIAVNGVEVPEVKTVARRWRCFPLLYTLNLRPYLHPGVNAVKLELSGGRTSYGLSMWGIYSPAAVLAMAACLGLAAYVGVLALRNLIPWLRLVSRAPLGRLGAITFVPCVEFMALWAMAANNQGKAWPQDPLVPAAVAMVIALSLLLRRCDGVEEKPFRSLHSSAAAAVSLAAAGYAALAVGERGWSDYVLQALALTGIVAGFFVRVRFHTVLAWLLRDPRAAAVAFVAAASPLAYWYGYLPLWVGLSGVTGALVRGILGLCGSTVAVAAAQSSVVFMLDRRETSGRFLDYFVSVSSPDFGVRIGAWCSGLEGVFLFFFLLSVFVLLDWDLFSKVRRLWAVYALTAPFVLVVNALRIACLFLYAEWAIRHYGKTRGTIATIHAFHSHIGWIVYTLAFALFLPLVYRWARRATAVS